MSDTTPNKSARPKQLRRRAARPPKRRNCKIYEQYVLAGETQEQLAAEFGITQQRVGQIAAQVEAWIATHADHPLAQRMRLRASRRWEAIWSRAIEGFDRSREDRQITKERVMTPPPPSVAVAVSPLSGGEDRSPSVTFIERTVRQQNGDPRFLTIAARAAERDDRFWRQEEVPAGSSETTGAPATPSAPTIGSSANMPRGTPVSWP